MRPASHTNRLFHLRCLASAIALGAAVFVSHAQGPGQPPPPPPGGGDLGGPPVPPGAKEGDGDFGGEGKPGRRAGGAGAMRERMQSGRAWMMTWAEFKGTLAPEQLEKAEKIQKEFESKMKAWQEANADKLKSLREQIEGAMGEGGRPDPSVMQEMQKLNESRPKAEDSQKQLFGLLNPEQQESFKKKLADTEAKMKERMQGRGGENGSGRPGGKGGEAGKGGKGGKGGKPGGPPPPPQDGQGAPPPPPIDQ